MGEHRVYRVEDERSARVFMRSILADIRALDTMIERGLVESGVRRIGVEQEMYLVDADGLASPIALDMMRAVDDPRFQTEVALFNLEANLEPRLLERRFLSDLEAELDDVLAVAARAAGRLNGRVLLTGILPTLRAEDVTVRNLTPEARYKCLNEASIDARGGQLTLLIDGIERFESSFQSVVVEGANTSIQLHLQVDPADSGRLYNLAQLLTAPLLAAAVNSPVLLGRRLWQETRVAVFERAFDDRSSSQMTRGVPTRVGFGSDWVRGSLVDLFRDNAARYQAIMMRDLPEDSMAVISSGGIPKLEALQLHNGTVWRWNRPCYGITDGKPHLRIENRALPGGPSVLDETANAAMFYGMMLALDGQYGPVAERLSFSEAKANFLASAHQGLEARYCWLDGRPVAARDLLLEQLIPAAREGLRSVDTPAVDVDRYLGVIEQRVASGRTGARWLLSGLDGEPESRRRTLCAAAVQLMLEQQSAGNPVHSWPDLDVSARQDAVTRRKPVLGDIMTRDLFTVRPDDIVDLATNVMDWKHIRHVPVEDRQGTLVGLLSTRSLVGLGAANGSDPVPVGALMSADPPVASPDCSLAEGVALMLETDDGCLLIVNGTQLVGIVTERDLLAALADGPV